MFPQNKSNNPLMCAATNGHFQLVCHLSEHHKCKVDPKALVGCWLTCTLSCMLGVHTHSQCIHTHSHSLTMHSHSLTLTVHSHSLTVHSHSHSHSQCIHTHSHSLTVHSHSHSQSHSHSLALTHSHSHSLELTHSAFTLTLTYRAFGRSSHLFRCNFMCPWYIRRSNSPYVVSCSKDFSIDRTLYCCLWLPILSANRSPCHFM